MRLFLASLLLAVSGALLLHADNTPQTLPFSQDWSNGGLITTDDNWSGVPGIVGYRGDDITTATGVDPQTLLADGTSTPVDVTANQTAPNTFTTGGVAEFAITDPVVALNGSGTADAPFLLINIATAGQAGIRVQMNLRDLDGSVDNSIQPIAIQYRIGNTGNFTNLAAAFVADASSGPSLATLVTPVDVTLPSDADNQALVQIRVMTANAAGNDEWIGIDDIQITAGGGGPQLSLTPSTLPGGTAGVAYSELLSIQNNNGQSCTFDSTGSVPGGLALNSATDTTVTLSGIPNTPGAFNFSVTADCGTAGSLSHPYTVSIAPGLTITKIHDVQGSGLSSPLVGQLVTVEGIVVGDFQGASGLPGFYVQEEDSDADSDPNTSEGVFIFDGSTPLVQVAVGDKVQVRGTVTEFASSGITLTELTSPTVTVIESGDPLPAIATLSFPALSTTDFERLEGMRVQILQPMTVTENFNHGAFGELAIAAGGRLAQPTNVVAPGSPALALQATNNLMRIVLDDGSNISRAGFVTWLYPENGGLAANNTARTGETIDGPITGVLDQRFGTYRIQQSLPLNFFTAVSNPRTAAPLGVGNKIRVAGANLLNFFTTLDTGSPVCGPTGGLDCRGANTPEEFTRQRDKLIAALNTLDAHVFALTELENNTTDSLQSIVDGLNSITPGKYGYVNTGTIGTDAIKVGIIYQPGVVTPIGSPAVLTNAVDIRTIDTRNRPALAQTFRPVGGLKTNLQRFTVVVNHFKSKGSSCSSANNPGEIPDPDANDGQDNCNLTRVSIAAALIDWLATNPTKDPTLPGDRKVLIMGDLNSYAMEDPISAMTSTAFVKPPVVNAGDPNATYVNLVKSFRGDGAYSYVFEGQSGYLDHALANPVLNPLVIGIDEWHNNADEPVAIDYNVEWTASILKTPAQQASLYSANAYRASDHDPVLVGFNPLCGDLDDDGDVDTADQDLMRAQLGQPATAANRRMNFDGDDNIDVNDLRIFQGCFRAFTPGPGLE